MASNYELAEETCRALIMRITRAEKFKHAKLEIFITREKGRQGLKLPGGQPEDEDESRFGVVIREALEEAGLDLSEKTPLVSPDGVYFSKEEKNDTHGTSVLVFCETGYSFDDEEQTDKDVIYGSFILGTRLPVVGLETQILTLDTCYYIHQILLDEKYQEAIRRKGVPRKEIQRVCDHVGMSMEEY